MTDLLQMTPELALRLVREAEGMDREEIARLQRQRLHALLAYARAHSPLCAEKYRHLPENPALEDIPPLLRAEAAPRFDEWVCDRDISSQSVRDFLASPDNQGKEYRGRYRVLATSGSTAAPLIIVRDARHTQINGALVQSRLWGGSKFGNIEALQRPWLRSCAITANGNHSSYLSFLRVQQAYQEQGFGQRIAFFPIDMPLPRMVDGLNALQPEIIGTYPSTLQILARMQQTGQLAIKPLALCSSAEYLSPTVLTMLETTFQCPVMDNYCSTEGGEVGMLCAANRRHVNCDWIIVEPVDAQMRPVHGEGLSDGVLITNLANLVQPMIRYHISDRAMLRYEACPCGSPFPVLEIEGRKEDILEFAGENGPFLMTLPVMQTTALHVDGCLAAQLVQRSPTELELRCETMDAADRNAVSTALLAAVRHIFVENDAANVRVYSVDAPLIRGKSGKLRTLLKDFSPPREHERIGAAR